MAVANAKITIHLSLDEAQTRLSLFQILIMILAFKEQFRKLILQGTKIHTIREDKPNRWKKGNTIHFATGVRTKNYECFEELTCWSVQKIEIKYFCENCSTTAVTVFVGDKMIGGALMKHCQIQSCHDSVLQLALNDGFKDVNEFLEWFSEDFEGKIIHWTNKKY